MSAPLAIQAPALPAEARVVAGYRLERRLGRGAMGEVWLGRHQETRGVAAIKLLRDSGTVRDKAQAFFARERRAIARLSHPSIVSLYEVGPDYLVTSLVLGVDLAHRLRSPLHPRVALRIAAEIASALAHAHAKGVIHGDVKPSNILLDKDEAAYLVDFGIAQIIDESDDLLGGLSAGTPAFMPPEQHRGEALTPRADQYALGRTLLAMLIGEQLPLDSSVALARLPAGLPPSLVEVIRRATAADPEARFASSEELAAALGAIVIEDHDQAPRLFPERRSAAPFAWCAHPQEIHPLSFDLSRADYRLSELVAAGVLDRDKAAAFSAATGQREFGWTVFGRGVFLGPLTDPRVFARASQIILLMHGVFSSRESWQVLARNLCRNNSHALVIAPDLHGGFASPYYDPLPSTVDVSPRALIPSLFGWLELLGARDLPLVMVGHSFSAVAMLAYTDEELGDNVHRVAITPVFPALVPSQARAMRWGRRLLRLLGRLRPLYLWVLRRLTNAGPAKRYPMHVRQRFHDTLVALPPAVLVRQIEGLERTAPAPGDQLKRCLIIVTPDDPVMSERDATGALAKLGFPADRVYRLAQGGHDPHGENEDQPEWQARNVDEMVAIVDAVLDSTRNLTMSTGATQDVSPDLALTSR